MNIYDYPGARTRAPYALTPNSDRRVSELEDEVIFVMLCSSLRGLEFGAHSKKRL